MVSRLARAIEILEAINEHFQGGGNIVNPLYPYALILEDDATIASAIADCLGEED